jgi:hypothetical protein
MNLIVFKKGVGNLGMLGWRGFIRVIYAIIIKNLIYTCSVKAGLC